MNSGNTGCRVLMLTPPQGLWADRIERPWNTTQPLGLAYIAAAARAAGNTVEAIYGYSLAMPAAELSNRSKDVQPALVGF